MYEIVCEDCGRVGVHPTRVGAQTRAEGHITDTGHRCSATDVDDS